MPDANVLLVDATGIVLIAWLLNTVRRGRLYVGYAAIFIATIGAGLVTLSVPPVLRQVNTVGTLLTSAAGLVVLALAFVVVMLIYILGQLTQISNRLTALAQELAIRGTAGREERREP